MKSYGELAQFGGMSKRTEATDLCTYVNCI